MKLCWFIDNDLMAEYHPDLANYIRSLGHDVISLSATFARPKFTLNPDCHYTFLGSFQELKYVQKYLNVPVATYGLGNSILRSVYASYLPTEWFLNSESIMTTWALLEKNRRWFFDKIGADLFVRPDSGKKTFTGQVFTFTPYNINEEMSFVGQNSSVQPESIVWVTPAKDIGREYRFWISNGKVVTWSEYQWNKTAVPPVSPTAAMIDLARTVAEYKWQADLIYTVDICEHEGEAKIIELNSFSCAGLYQCDAHKLLEIVSQDILAEWED